MGGDMSFKDITTKEENYDILSSPCGVNDVKANQKLSRNVNFLIRKPKINLLEPIN